jgi:hypothetical protein
MPTRSPPVPVSTEVGRLLATDADAPECVDDELWRGWVGDLQLLGLRPRVLLAGAAIELG